MRGTRRFVGLPEDLAGLSVKSKQLVGQDDGHILDDQNRRFVAELSEKAPTKLRKLSSFLSDDWPADVPDPYYGGRKGFDQVLDMIEAACPAILDELIEPA